MIIKSLEQLNSFSEKVADHLQEKDYIFLIGEIGVGKTTFTRFLINNLQKKEGSKSSDVLSPTFNLLYEYDLKKYKIMHYDLFRLKEEKELNDLGIFQENQNAIKIIEWPNLIKIPMTDKLEIYLDYVKDDNQRKIRLLGTGKWKNFE
jgi:tRNA threonylcarbamoyladenosine biosynthesis protein TsaE